MSASSGFGKAQATALLERLRVAKDENIQRIYFVDVDVLSTYIDAQNGDILSDWSSLFSLTPESKPRRGEPIDESSRELADATARAVSGFLMGPFRQGLTAQSGRFWVTPEHEQELDGMIHAVIEGGHEPIALWHKTLADLYLSLPGADPVTGDLTKRLTEIFAQLRAGTGVGKVTRAYGVKRQFTATADRSAVFPPPDLGRAFALTTDTREFQRRVAYLARTAIDVLMENVENRQRTKELMPAIRQLHDLAYGWHSDNLSNRDLTAKVLRDTTLRNMLTAEESTVDRWIITSARIAAAHVADAYSLARIVGLSEVLNGKNPLRQPFRWKVCLLSGASNPHHMLKGLQAYSDGLGTDVDIVHPLSVMRFDEFLSPRHRPQEQSESMQMLGQEYALGVLRDPEKVAEKLDTKQFLLSLTQLLTQASAAFAHFDDRSLKHLRNRIQSDPDYPKVVRAIGNAISSRFIDTYVQLNAVARPDKERLPAINLPWLSMPHPAHARSPAEDWVDALHAEVHGSLKGKKIEATRFDVAKLLDSDPTGYSATLCAALGYLAMGKWALGSAENAANTAARNALISPDELAPDSYTPEGNEALYLSAFVSRMRVRPDAVYRRAAFEWRDAHIGLMAKARERMARWNTNHSAITSRPVANSGCTLAELVYWRYDIEDAARDVYCLMVDGFAPTKKLSAVEELAAIPQGSLYSGCFDELVGRLAKVQAGLSKIGSGKAHSEVGFAQAQLLATAIQCWLCERLHLELAKQRKKPPSELERLVKRILESVRSSTDGSQLLKLLIAMFDRHRVDQRSLQSTVTSPRIQATDPMNKFAEIDIIRDKILCAALDADPMVDLVSELERQHIPFKPAEGLRRSR